MWLIEQRQKHWVCRQVSDGRLWGSWQPVVNLRQLSSPGCESVTYLGASRRTTKKRRQDRGRTSRFSRRSNGQGGAVRSRGSHSANHACYFLLSWLYCHKLYSINWYYKYISKIMKSVCTASKFSLLGDADQQFDQPSLYVAVYKDGGPFTSIFPLSTKAT